MSKLKPMKAYIGQWKEQIDGPDIFEVHAYVESTEPADIRKAIKGMPYGNYQMITGRERTVQWSETKTQTLAIEGASNPDTTPQATEPPSQTKD